MLSVFWGTGYLTKIVLNRESLDIICAPYVGEEQVANFETVFYALRYIFLTEQLRKEYSVYISQKTNKYIPRP